MAKRYIFTHYERDDKDTCNCSDEFREFIKKAHEIQNGNNKYHEKFRKKHDELHRYLRLARYLRPLFLIIYLTVLYLIFRWIGIKTIGIFVAAIIIIKEIAEFMFLRSLEKRVVKPIDKLKRGVEEIAKGNYDVKIECNIMNDIGLLIASFNDMAEKLRESEKMKTEYEENRKMLIANISHDLKTPITSIQGYIEAILDGNAVSSNDTNKYLQVIYRNSDYINRLIDDLFLFSKLDMQKLNFNFEEVKVKAFMNDLVEEFRFELEEKQIELVYEDKVESECLFNIDRKRMHQAIRNIIGNAEKYGPEKGLKIGIQIIMQDNFVCMDIKDNGPGIPEDKLQHVFDRFFRIDDERKKDLMSTGLGLAIARELIEAHEGKIAVQSEVGEGTCFSIAIPVIQMNLRDV